MTDVTCGIQGVVYKLRCNTFPVSVTVCFCVFVCGRVRVRENEYLRREKRDQKKGRPAGRVKTFIFFKNYTQH